jgi:hypothetical protein
MHCRLEFELLGLSHITAGVKLNITLCNILCLPNYNRIGLFVYVFKTVTVIYSWMKAGREWGYDSTVSGQVDMIFVLQLSTISMYEWYLKPVIVGCYQECHACTQFVFLEPCEKYFILTQRQTWIHVMNIFANSQSKKMMLEVGIFFMYPQI